MRKLIDHVTAGVPWRLPVFCVLFSGAAFLCLLDRSESALAQSEANAAEDLGTDEDGEAKDAQEPAENAPSTDTEDSKESDTKRKAKKSYLAWAWESLGIGYSLVFLCLSFVLVALFVMNLMTARRDNVVPVSLVEEFEGLLNEKQYQEAYELARNDESFLGQVLSAGLSKLSSGYSQSIEAMQEVGEEENMKLEHRLSYMALIGTISPMIGLLGTVQGIIGAFQEIALTSSGAPNAQDLAGHLATALFTTLVGLIIAIPAIAAYNILRNRVARLVLEVGIVSEGLMGRFQSMDKKN
ncbi:MAG: MotA/TolQ/ExbB proton channel family protein [Pirellulales bacterium]|nr:MotA/TolQ/ExbB proton channel family protein [Pirellulales bacterium]